MFRELLTGDDDLGARGQAVGLLQNLCKGGDSIEQVRGTGLLGGGHVCVMGCIQLCDGVHPVGIDGLCVLCISTFAAVVCVSTDGLHAYTCMLTSSHPTRIVKQ